MTVARSLCLYTIKTLLTYSIQYKDAFVGRAYLPTAFPHTYAFYTVDEVETTRNASSLKETTPQNSMDMISILL